MLEKLPDIVGHVLREHRAGLDQTAYRQIDLREGTAALTLTSTAFVDHGPIPARYTADAEDGDAVSPPLQWRGVPAAAASLVLIVEDGDAPTPHPLVHVIVVDLPLGDGGLAEGAICGDEHAGAGLEIGRNSFLQRGWLPPDPPPGHGVHRYAFQLFALDAGAVFDSAPGRDALLDVVRAHAIASGCLIGTYERPDGSVPVAKGGATEAVAPLSLGATPI